MGVWTLSFMIARNVLYQLTYLSPIYRKIKQQMCINFLAKKLEVCMYCKAEYQNVKSCVLGKGTSQWLVWYILYIERLSLAMLPRLVSNKCFGSSEVLPQLPKYLGLWVCATGPWLFLKGNYFA
jgi:hypothetical protein